MMWRNCLIGVGACLGMVRSKVLISLCDTSIKL